MPSSIKKIGFILALIVLLPMIVYSIYELSNQSNNEKILEKIYNEQLDAIIFSVNQYADDIVNSWASQIKQINLFNSYDRLSNSLVEYSISNPSISLIVIADTSFSNNMQFYSSKRQPSTPAAVERMQKIFEDNSDKIEILLNFKRKNYDKIESLDNNLDDTPLLSFLTEDNQKRLKIATIAVNMEVFINNILLKKINSISDEDLIISIFHNQELLSNTGTTSISFNDLLESKNLINFQNYFLGISTKGTTINDIVKRRSNTNLVILLLLNSIILIGAWFVFRNIRKEVQLSQLKSDFVSNVSHEIRTPLSLIRMFAETLEMHRVKSEEKKDEYYRIIRKETERLTGIVNSILNLSKMESSSRKFKFEMANLNVIVDDVLKTYQHTLNPENCETVKESDLPNIKLDFEAATEAIINLIDNALKYSNDNFNIKIITGNSDGFVYVEVQDNGLGISKDNQKKIFDKFYRVASGDIHNTQGSGLGLSLVKHIMEAHKGTVTVSSKLGVGSKFRLNFPINF